MDTESSTNLQDFEDENIDLVELEERLYAQIHHGDISSNIGNVNNSDVTITTTTSIVPNKSTRNYNGVSRNYRFFLNSNRYWLDQSNRIESNQTFRPRYSNPLPVDGVMGLGDKSVITLPNNNNTLTTGKSFTPYTSILSQMNLAPSSNKNNVTKNKGYQQQTSSAAVSSGNKNFRKPDNVKQKKNIEKKIKKNETKVNKVEQFQMKREKANKIRQQSKKKTETIVLDSDNDDDDIVEVPLPSPPVVCIDDSDESILTKKDLMVGTIDASPQTSKRTLVRRNIPRGVSPSSSVLSDDFIGQHDRIRLADSLDSLNIVTEDELRCAPETVAKVLQRSKSKELKNSEHLTKKIESLPPSKKSKIEFFKEKQIAEQTDESSAGSETSENNFNHPENTEMLNVSSTDQSGIDVQASPGKIKATDSAYAKGNLNKNRILSSSDSDTESSDTVLETVKKSKSFRKRKSSGSNKSSEYNTTSNEDTSDDISYIIRGEAISSGHTNIGQKRKKMISDNQSDDDFISMLSNIIQDGNRRNDDDDDVEIIEYSSEENPSISFTSSNKNQIIIDNSVIEIEESDISSTSSEGVNIALNISSTDNQADNICEVIEVNDEDDSDQNSGRKSHDFNAESGWNEEMKHFYNDSWGGESFDVNEILKTLPRSTSDWYICGKDRRQPLVLSTVRCYNCHELGHKRGKCKAPVKKIVCCMCGEFGHQEPRCPNKICLRCGSYSRVFSDFCSKCMKFDRTLCQNCKIYGHPDELCPDKWRRYHSTIEPNAPLKQTIIFQQKKYCCICAGRGHTAENCQNALKILGCQIDSMNIKSYEQVYDPLDDSTEQTVSCDEFKKSGKFKFKWRTNIDKSERSFYGRFLKTLPNPKTNKLKEFSFAEEINKLQTNESENKFKLDFITKTIEKNQPEKSVQDDCTLKICGKNIEDINNQQYAEKICEKPDKIKEKSNRAGITVTFNCTKNERCIRNSDSNNSFPDFFDPIQSEHEQENRPLQKTNLDTLPDYISLETPASSINQIEEIVSNKKEEDEKSEAKIFLSKENTKHLLARPGTEFLIQLAQQCNVLCRMDFESIGNILVLNGTPDQQNNFHSELVKYLHRMGEHNQFMDNSIPKNRLALIDFILNHLTKLSTEIGNARNLYKRMCRFEKNPTKMGKKAASRMRKRLNIILLGQLGLGEGKFHLSALKSHLVNLQNIEHTSKVSVSLRNEIYKHIEFIFSSFRHNNYEELMEKYRDLNKNNQLPENVFKKNTCVKEATQPSSESTEIPTQTVPVTEDSKIPDTQISSINSQNTDNSNVKIQEISQQQSPQSELLLPQPPVSVYEYCLPSIYWSEKCHNFIEKCLKYDEIKNNENLKEKLNKINAKAKEQRLSYNDFSALIKLNFDEEIVL